MMRRGNAGEKLRRWSMGVLLSILYVFLYTPIGYVIYASFSEDIVWPFPPSSRFRAMRTCSPIHFIPTRSSTA